MKIIIVSIFVIGAIIFAMVLITSILNNKINRLEDEMYKLKLDLTLGSDNEVQSSLNVKSSKHSDRSGLPSSQGGVEEYERAPKPWSPFYDNSGNSASRNFTTYKTPKEPLGPLLPEKKTNKITSINFENGNGVWVRYTTLTPDTLYWKHSVDPDLLSFPQTDKTGKFQGDCVVRWKDIARIVEVDKKNKGETQ